MAHTHETAAVGADLLPMLRPRRETESWYEIPDDLVDVAGRTDTGKVRERNEDQFLVADVGRSLHTRFTSVPVAQRRRLVGVGLGKLLAVADGVGGQPGGDLASAVAIDTLVEYVLFWSSWPPRAGTAADEVTTADLGDALIAAEARVRQAAAATDLDPSLAATTLTAVLVIRRRCYLAHAGDSRCYRLHDGALEQLTSDHTLGAQMEKAAPSFMHMLYNSVGGVDHVKPELRTFDLARGDTLLLCTDGLTRHLPDEKIAAHLMVDRAPWETCEALIDAATAAGGSDNITVVVATT